MKRWLMRICLFVILGAVVNVAVAWWSSVRNCSDNAIYARYVAAVPPGSATPNSLPGQSLSHYDVAWLEHWQFHPQHQTDVYRFETKKVTLQGPAFRQVAFTEWKVALIDIGGRIAQPLSPFSVRLEVGWPFFALSDALWEDHQGGKQLNRWHHRRAVQHDTSGDRIALPYSPLWPGFAINTVFYALVLWLLFAAPFALRRRRRIRRGLCPKCAYDLRGTEASVCPECGSTK